MGEISFNYDVSTEPIHQMAFRYLFSDSIEYSFAYQRYVAFSDASILNNPVAITKVATGLTYLYDLFVDKQAGATIYKSIIEFQKKQYDTGITSNVASLDKQSKGIDIVEQQHEVYTISYGIHFDKNFSDKSEFLQRCFSSNMNRDILACTGITEQYIPDIALKDYWIIKNEDYNTVIFENPIVKELYHNELNSFNVYQVQRNNYLDILSEDRMAVAPDYIVNVLKTFLVEYKYDLEASVNTDYFINKYGIGNIYKGAFGNRPDRDLYIDSKDIFGKLPILELNKYRDFNAYMYGRTPSYYDHSIVSKEDVIGNHLRNDLLYKEINKGLYNQEYAIYTHDKIMSYFNIDTFGIMEYKHCIILKTLQSQGGPIILNYYQQTYQSSKFGNQGSIFKELHGKTGGKISYLDPIYDSFAFQGNKIANFTNKPVYAARGKSTASILYKNLFINRNQTDGALYGHAFVKTDGKSFEIKNTGICINKGGNPFEIKDLYVAVFQDGNSIDIYTDTSITRDSSKFNDGVTIPLTKDNKFSDIYNQMISTDKDNKFSRLFENQTWLDKIEHDSTIQDNLLQLDKSSYYSRIFKQGKMVIKNLMSLFDVDFDTVIKNSIPSDYINVLTSNYSGLIIPLSKNKHQSYIDNINTMVQKIAANGFITQQMSMSKIPGFAYVPSLDTFFDKKEFNAYIEYKNIQVAKAKIRSYISKDEVVKKQAAYGFIESQIWLDKSSVKGWLSNQVKLEKEAHSGLVKGIYSLTLEAKNTQANEKLFVDKDSQLCYYDYNITWADKEGIDAQLNKQLIVNKNEQQTHFLDCVSPIIKSKIDTLYDYVIFATRPIRESNLFNQIMNMNRTHYDLKIHPDDFGNWAWVYETPDPIENVGFGIDELLLPENDTRYEDFKDVIFDKQTLMPRNPVKALSETSFVAKYPIKHPLPNFDKIGIEYIDVETSIMKTVFLKFYRIWQSKIYEFGTMSMVQSTKLMLEYMYTWILTYFPLEEIEQALRVFRLIRWYGETSIIQNSQYIVSYEYDTLESKLNTGECLVPSNLNDTDATMIVDSHLGVIKCKPEFIGQRVFVEFYIENKKNTTFIFSLSNTVGSVNIYINDEHVDTVSVSTLNLVYELPYTGETNVVRIEKEANHNLNNTFYIGNIKVPNCTFKDLSIDFDPTLRAGNKPLNDIAKKMIAFANLYENKDEAYELIQKGNLGVGETYKRLMEYWDLHHQDKEKGKRLTIKEV